MPIIKPAGKQYQNCYGLLSGLQTIKYFKTDDYSFIKADHSSYLMI